MSNMVSKVLLPRRERGVHKGEKWVKGDFFVYDRAYPNGIIEQNTRLERLMKNTSVQEEGDWEITADGLYMATRGFLTRRGYCCANQCRNCPYINWRDNPEWRPVAHKYVRKMRVSAKAVAGAQALLTYHHEHVDQGTHEERERHRAMIEHYSFLLEKWITQ